MAQSLAVDVIQSALWAQGDIRDPLGVWGGRLLVTGDASGGEIKVVFQVPATDASAYIYTCYSVNPSVLVAAGSADLVGIMRLLTNWPDIDPSAGIQGYATNRSGRISIQAPATSPAGGLRETTLMQAFDRFILLFDPRSRTTPLDIVELRMTTQVLADTYAFEAYGYFWDRSVLNAPGGPRHPGSS